MRVKTTVRLLAATVLALLLSVQVALAGRFEDELLSLINRYRSAHKCKTLASTPLYTDLARGHSRAMQEQNSLGHDGFNDRFRQAAGARSCVENVGWNHETPQSLFNGWKDSPGHRENMLNRKISRAGISKSGAYVTFFACY